MFELIKDPDTEMWIKVNSTKGKKILNTYAQLGGDRKGRRDRGKAKKTSKSRKERTGQQGLYGKQIGCERVNVKKKKQDDKLRAMQQKIINLRRLRLDIDDMIKQTRNEIKKNIEKGIEPSNKKDLYRNPICNDIPPIPPLRRSVGYQSVLSPREGGTSIAYPFFCDSNADLSSSDNE